MASKANLKSSGREAALARRQALSTSGKKGVRGATRERSATPRVARRTADQPANQPAAHPNPTTAVVATAPGAAPAPRAVEPRAGFFTAPPVARQATTPVVSAVAPRPASGRSTAAPVTPALASRNLALQRRTALSKQGRKAARGGDRTRVDAVKDAARAPAVAAKPADCGCNGGCRETARGNGAATVAAPSIGMLSHGNGATARAAGNGTRNKRADAALAAKPTGRALSQNRRAALSGRGKAAAKAPQSIASLARQTNPTLSGRELAQQVRSQRSTNGGIGATRSSRPAGRVRPQPAAAADQPWKVGLSETAAGQFVTGTKVGRSGMTTGDEPSTCRTITGTEYMGADIFREFCQSEPTPGVAKVRVSPTGHGNRVTGNEVGRSTRVTGDEPGTCKHITGTEYLSPNQVAAFCDLTPAPGPRKVGITRTGGGEQVSGTLVGRSGKVTGDEHGAGIRPTGTQYTNPSDNGVPLIERGKGGGGAGRTDSFAAFAGARVAVNTSAPMAGPNSAPVSAPVSVRPPSATKAASRTAGPTSGTVPPKVATTHTLAGGTVTGTRVGRSERVTGDEPGSCRLVTGDEYLDLGHFQAFCGSDPAPEPPKVGQSQTLKGQRVSGTQAGRSSKVTGDEPGTCKAITGTPYAGLEQADAFCEAPQRAAITARTRPTSVMPMPRMTGIQPGIDRPRAEGGVVSGAHRGACEPVSGTPYIGADQYAAACGTIGSAAGGASGADDGGGNGALPGQPDFPQSLDGAPWQQFSVMSPAREAFAASAERESAAQVAGHAGGVTGTLYESNRHITGPFGMATGKITGTEQFRSDGRRATSVLTANDPVAGAPTATGDALPVVPSRVTGEGQSAGTKVTGDDWERGERVTGTEGRSARRRNPTRPGSMGAMPAIERKRNEDVPAPVSLVTGSAGSSARGSLVTYSGGARG